LVCPDEAGIGAAPQAIAKLPVDRNILGLPVSPSSLAAVIAPTPTIEMSSELVCRTVASIRLVTPVGLQNSVPL
jgi:hypothetical protein